MDIGSLPDSLYKLPYILSKDGVVTEVSQPLIDVTEFTCDELLNKSIEDFFKTLKVGPNINVNNIDEEIDYFMFTKSLEVRMFNIEVVGESNESLYLFIEKPTFDVKFPLFSKLCLDNYVGMAVFSMPDITLLKANETFISFFDEPFNRKENCIGKRVSEFVTGFEGSPSEKNWENIIETGQTVHLDEYTFNGFERGITYWESTLSPVYEEGKLKYCVEMTTDITEKVMQRKKLEEQEEIIRKQNEQLKWQADLLNLSSEAIFIWKLDGGIIYWNKGAELMYGYSSEEALGRASHDLLKTVHPFNIDDLESILKEQEIWRGTIEHTCRDGRKLIISTSHQIITDQNGQKLVLEINRDVTEIKRMEHEVKQQKNELVEIIQSIDDAIFIYDENKNFYLVNKAAKELFKDDEFSNFENLNTNTPYQYYDENGDEITTENLVVSRVSRGEVVINYKMTFKSDLETKHMSVNGRPIYDKEGNLKFVVIVCRNITQDIDAQRLMETQKQELEAIIENMSDTLMVFDKHGNYKLKNKAASGEMSAEGYMNVGDSYTPEMYFDLDGNEVPLDRIPSMRVLNGERIVEQILHVKHPSGERYVSVSGTPIYDSNGDFRMGVVCTRDVTKAIKQNKEIRQQMELFEVIINTMQESLYVIDKSGNSIVPNKVAKERLQTKFGSIVEVYNACSIFDYNGKEITLEEMPANRVLKGETIKNQILHYYLNDREFYIVSSGTPVVDDKGEVIYAVVSTRDISDLVKNEKDLKEAQEKLFLSEVEKNKVLEQTLEIKDEFLSLISHEFRTPLNVINTAIQAINYFCINDLPEKARKYLDMIKLNTFRQLRLVNNLLDITRADAGRMKINKRNLDIVFISKAITESVQVYASQKGINLDFMSHFKEKVIGIDDEKYERILLNLLSNAIKFTPEGKSITVKLISRKNHTCIEVKDEGIGMPKDKLGIIFERFGQVDSSLSRQAEGTGIGLSLVKKFVEALGGSISVKSSMGKGSTFTILLPDETVIENINESEMADLLDNRLVHVTNVEFSDIYL